jgi:hypothetical protein
MVWVEATTSLKLRSAEKITKNFKGSNHHMTEMVSDVHASVFSDVFDASTLSLARMVMMHSQSLEAIVLRTYNVGEADRFCILFTRERGRVAARAGAVRKLTSRMGGTLLPLRHVRIQAKESSAGLYITSATPVSDHQLHELPALSRAQEGIELLLALVQEEESLPEIFHATVSFLRACEAQKEAVLAYSFFLFHALGLLPSYDAGDSQIAFSDDERLFLKTALRGSFDALPVLTSSRRLQSIRDALLRGQLSSPLRSPGVIAAL